MTYAMSSLVLTPQIGVGQSSLFPWPMTPSAEPAVSQGIAIGSIVAEHQCSFPMTFDHLLVAASESRRTDGMMGLLDLTTRLQQSCLEGMSIVVPGNVEATKGVSALEMARFSSLWRDARNRQRKRSRVASGVSLVVSASPLSSRI